MQDTVIASKYEGKDLYLTGVIDSVPQLKKYVTSKGKDVESAKFILHVEHAKDEAGNQIENLNKIQLGWYNPIQQLKAGQRWNLIVRLKKPVGFANEGGFDYERMLFSKQLGAKGYVTKRKKAQLKNGTSIVAWNDILREKVIDRLESALPDSDFNGIIKALSTGHRADISRQQWNGLLVSGTNHLVAISGLHIGLIAGIAFFFFKLLWYSIPTLRLRVAPIKIGAVGAIIAALGYAALAGFSVPTQRALLMVVLLMLGLLLKRYTRPESILAIALAGVILIEPLAVLTPGFWLSFSAVLIILLAMRKCKFICGWKGVLWQWIQIQCAISIGLAPLTLLFFERVSIVSPFVNLIAVPLFSTVIVPVVFIAMVFLFVIPQVSTALFLCVQWLLEQFWMAIEFIAGLEFATFSCSRVATIAVTLMLAVVVVSIYLRRWHFLISIPVVAVVILFSAPTLQTGEFYIDFLDVGQGTAIMVKTANHNLLYDAGPNRSLDAGESVILPYLGATGVDMLDKMVVSHADNDHAGGAKAVITAIQVQETIVGEHLKNIEAPLKRCIEGQRWFWDGVEFSFIYPFYSKKKKPKSGNDASCVLLIKSEYGSLLLTGDITKSVENKLVKHHRDNQLDIDIVLVPHHGSKGSSSKSFINALSPKYAVVTSGYRNRYKFPKPAVVQAYAHAGAKMVNTADSGMITIRVTKEGIQKPEQYRREKHRIWMAVEPDNIRN